MHQNIYEFVLGLYLFIKYCLSIMYTFCACIHHHVMMPLQATTDVQSVAANESTRKQPFLLLTCDESGEVTQSYIVVDFKLISASSNVLQALDKLFKAYYVFNVDYPHELKSFFEFLQMAIYNIEAHKMSSSIRDLKVRLAL